MATRWKGQKIKHFADYVGAHLRPEERQALEALCTVEQASMSEVIRRLITKEHARVTAAVALQGSEDDVA